MVLLGSFCKSNYKYYLYLIIFVEYHWPKSDPPELLTTVFVNILCIYTLDVGGSFDLSLLDIVHYSFYLARGDRTSNTAS